LQVKKSGSQIEDQEYQTQSPGSGFKTGWYDRGMKDRGMKEKTSITLSQAVLKGIDRIAASKKGSKPSRSALIEAVLAEYLRRQARAQVDARDLELINRAMKQDALEAEVEDVLGYQSM
jgi:predicted transcriptional regulator